MQMKNRNEKLVIVFNHERQVKDHYNKNRHLFPEQNRSQISIKQAGFIL